MASLQWLFYNGFVAEVFASPVRPCLQTKLPSFLKMGYARPYRPNVKENENVALAVRTFS